MNNHSSKFSWLLSVLVLLSGCGGVRNSSPSSGSLQQSPDIAGNWQFDTTSLAGMASGTLSGSVARSGKSVSGAVHVDGSNCFDRLATINLTGTVTGSSVSLTSVSIAGQVITLTGNITDTSYTGTYAINGGCADGDHGSVSGTKVPYLANLLVGTFTTSGQQTFDVSGNIAQNRDPNLDGSYGIAGTATFSTSCFSSGTVTPGTLLSGSFILGKTVAFEIETANGKVTFLGTLSQERTGISGDYATSGGTCDGTGTAVFTLSSPWDY